MRPAIAHFCLSGSTHTDDGSLVYSKSQRLCAHGSTYVFHRQGYGKELMAHQKSSSKHDSSPGKDEVQAPQRPPTSADVARLANVSRATVSFVLNNVWDSRVSEETQERVMKAAEELGYVPHAIARSLRAGRSNLVI